MTTHGLTWDYLRSFLHVIKTGSLSAAAANLGLTQPTLGRHIKALEQAIGQPLFVRSQNGFIPTEEALDLVAYAQNMENNAAAFLREAPSQQEDLIGTVRISASEIVGSKILPPILNHMHQAYPHLNIELVVSNLPDDLLNRAADIAIRMFKPSQQSLVFKRVGEAMIGIHAHKDYLKRRGTPATLKDLKHHTIIGYDSENEFLRKLLKALPGLTRDHISLRTQSDVAQLEAIRAGFGLGFCQVAVARQDRDLIRVLTEEFAYPLSVWVVMSEDLKNSKRCKLAFKALVDGLKDFYQS